MNRIGSIKGRRVLLLQGPMGPFFKKLDRLFRLQGAQTYRIGFNAGDGFFSYRDNYTPYCGTPEEWGAFIERFLREKKIELIFLFGDCRFYQSIAIKVAMSEGVKTYVFEEGYIRPDYVTMERWGVNDYSQISRDPEFYRSLQVAEPPRPLPANTSKTAMVLDATLYYLVANLLHWRYPHYRHHRGFSAIEEAFVGVRGALRKLYYPLYDRKYLPLVTGELSKKFYFVPLQTHNDFQILQHSSFQSIEKFIITVLESYARHAPKDRRILFKHHPVDRGRKNYKRFIFQQAEILGIEDRVIVVHDLHLPTILGHAYATVTVNSTVGMSAIAYGVPTIALGNAIYDFEGLCNSRKTLDEFWGDPTPPDPELYKKFHAYLIENTQLNGSFYGRFPVEFETGEIFGEPDQS